jgi:hypothetical protein
MKSIPAPREDRTDQAVDHDDHFERSDYPVVVVGYFFPAPRLERTDWTDDWSLVAWYFFPAPPEFPPDWEVTFSAENLSWQQHGAG